MRFLHKFRFTNYHTQRTCLYGFAFVCQLITKLMTKLSHEIGSTYLK